MPRARTSSRTSASTAFASMPATVGRSRGSAPWPIRRLWTTEGLSAEQRSGLVEKCPPGLSADLDHAVELVELQQSDAG